ncbi:hypothetical protein [Planctopirus hydrillae]|uniref:Uncharacterized protein n=1 Tax=Planctopirus hydrillae TaxID=1841610 RepID=A0A1C3E6B2_9PLAN|nr:hypothetical protein [Planctopirus hydrillae]ODA28788.1 hypothetical protein A6X21_11105 [Planctopirus hydrillae]
MSSDFFDWPLKGNEISTTLQGAIGILFLVAGCWISALNWMVAWQAWVLRQHTPSWVPLMGGTLLASGFWLYPQLGLSSVWWIGFFLDYGCVLGFLLTIIGWILFLFRAAE